MEMLKLNLQMFADTQTTLLNNPGNDLSPEMKVYYHDTLIDNAEPNLVYDQFGSKYPIPAHGGKTIEFRKYSPLPKALTPITEGVTPKGNKLNVTTLTATVQQYGDYIEISDVLETTAIDRNLQEATGLLGSQAGRTMDTVTREVVCAGTNKMFAPKVDADGKKTEILLRSEVTKESKLTPAVIRKAVAKLKRMNAVPINGSYVAIIHPDVTCDLTGDDEWIDSHKYAKPEEIYNGEIGRIAGVRFVESTEAKIIAPAELWEGVNRLHVIEAISSSGANKVKVAEAASAEDMKAINDRIQAGEEIKLYVNGVEVKLNAVGMGYAEGLGSYCELSLAAAVKDVPVDATVCGYGAGADGSAIYCTVMLAQNAYGTTEVSGLGLQHIVKQLGSGGTTDPLNQRSTTGWKATKTAERLVEEYMIRIEHSSESFGDSAKSN